MTSASAAGEVRPFQKAIMDAMPECMKAAVTVPASARQVAGNHYKAMAVQPWDVVDTWPREQRIGFYRGNALKYLMRMGSKDEQAQEAAKGQHYLEKLLEVLRETHPGHIKEPTT